MKYTGITGEEIRWVRGEWLSAEDRILSEGEHSWVADGLGQPLTVRGTATLDAVLIYPGEGAWVSARGNSDVYLRVLGGVVRIHAADQAQVTIRAVGAHVILDIEDEARVQVIRGPQTDVSGYGRITIMEDAPDGEAEVVNISGWTRLPVPMWRVAEAS